MAKKFIVCVLASKTTNKIRGFTVNDGNNDKEITSRPDAAAFMISILYDENTQRIRATKFAKYLNDIVDINNDLEKDQAI